VPLWEAGRVPSRRNLPADRRAVPEYFAHLGFWPLR
jgi:hypothetical protein